MCIVIARLVRVPVLTVTSCGLGILSARTGTMLGMGSVGLLIANPKTLVKVWNCLDRCDVADLLVWNSLGGASVLS